MQCRTILTAVQVILLLGIHIQLFCFINLTNSCFPEFLISRIHNDRSVLRKNSIVLEIRLLYRLQVFGSSYSSQQLQLSIYFSLQQLLILHQPAFSLSRHPGHLSFLYFSQLPQYKPQAAIRYSASLILFVIFNHLVINSINLRSFSDNLMSVCCLSVYN